MCSCSYLWVRNLHFFQLLWSTLLKLSWNHLKVMKYAIKCLHFMSSRFHVDLSIGPNSHVSTRISRKNNSNWWFCFFSMLTEFEQLTGKTNELKKMAFLELHFIVALTVPYLLLFKTHERRIGHWKVRSIFFYFQHFSSVSVFDYLNTHAELIVTILLCVKIDCLANGN